MERAIGALVAAAEMSVALRGHQVRIRRVMLIFFL